MTKTLVAVLTAASVLTLAGVAQARPHFHRHFHHHHRGMMMHHRR